VTMECRYLFFEVRCVDGDDFWNTHRAGHLSSSTLAPGTTANGTPPPPIASETTVSLLTRRNPGSLSASMPSLGAANTSATCSAPPLSIHLDANLRQPTAADKTSSCTNHHPDNPNEDNIPRLSDADTTTW